MQLIKWLKRLLKSLSISENVVNYINGGEVLPSPLTIEEETDFVERLKNGEEHIKDKLIEHNLRLVVFLAKKYENTNVDLEDLVSIGTIGLIKTILR